MAPISQTKPFLLRVRSAPYTCPACGQPAGVLYHDADTPDGACLSCKIDRDQEQQQREEEYADAAAWAERVSTCGSD